MVFEASTLRRQTIEMRRRHSRGAVACKLRPEIIDANKQDVQPLFALLAERARQISERRKDDERGKAKRIVEATGFLSVHEWRWNFQDRGVRRERLNVEFSRPICADDVGRINMKSDRGSAEFRWHYQPNKGRSSIR